MNVTRLAMALAIAISGFSHAYLYVHGYHHIPTIGTAFLVQAAVSFALAVLIVMGGPSWLLWAAAGVAGGALGAFVMSRTVGLFGFSETGWEPSPHAVIDVVVELLAVGLWAVYVLRHRRVASTRDLAAVASAPRLPQPK